VVRRYPIDPERMREDAESYARGWLIEVGPLIRRNMPTAPGGYAVPPREARLRSLSREEDPGSAAANLPALLGERELVVVFRDGEGWS
jgi:hypothetical protein